MAVDIGQPLCAVRRWLRAGRGESTEWLQAEGGGWMHRGDREVFATMTPAPTRLGDTLTALAAAGAIRAPLTPHVPAWTLIGRLTHGRLVPARAG